MLAYKMTNDVKYNLGEFSKICNIGLRTLVDCEVCCLIILDYNILVTGEELKYINTLRHNYKHL
jgi:hypothetical protein